MFCFFDDLDLIFKVIILYVIKTSKWIFWKFTYVEKSLRVYGLMALTPFARSLELLAIFTKSIFLEAVDGIPSDWY